VLLLRTLQSSNKKIDPPTLGHLGKDAYHGDDLGYARKAGINIEKNGGHVPYVIEAHVSCEKVDKRADSDVDYHLTVNRSRTTAELSGWRQDDSFVIKGCGLLWLIQASAGKYEVDISVITPHLALTTDGKSPDLTPYHDTIAETAGKAMRSAHKKMDRPDRMSTKGALWHCALASYQRASGDGQFSPSSRQVFYQARPTILRLTGTNKLDSNYITQTLIPAFEYEHSEDTAEWDITYDARGHLIEPHTMHKVGLGTIEVRGYLDRLDDNRSQEPVRKLDGGVGYLTTGPRHRYRNLLFLEKEGFNKQLQQAKVGERYDLAIMSTKGMSNIAARKLADDLVGSGEVDRILVAHDFDISGFGIFHTLTASTNRHRYKHDVQFVDIGLRLTDVEAMGLQAEPVDIKHWEADAARMASRGVTKAELAFLKDQRVELNAMSAPQFIEWIERKLVENDVIKVVPPDDVLLEHAAWLMERREAQKALDAMPKYVMPPLDFDLKAEIAKLLRSRPELSWDLAVASIIPQE
jgi:Topoisomerase 6 subunit A/Spo11, Toprim domain